MIILDTNVLSEQQKVTADPRVREWLDSQAIDTLFLTTITLAEIRYGIAALPDGRRKNVLQSRIENEVFPLFERRVLSFDEPSSRSYAILMAEARQAGKAIGSQDGFIAAIARANDMIVATRDTSPFEAAGVKVIDPWNVAA